MAVIIAIVHDELLKQPSGRFAHDCEQIALATTFVLGMLGGLLVIEGHRLFEEARGFGSIHAVTSPTTGAVEPVSPAFDAATFDTRQGVALLLARRALADAAECASRTPTGIADRADPPRA